MTERMYTIETKPVYIIDEDPSTYGVTPLSCV